MTRSEPATPVTQHPRENLTPRALPGSVPRTAGTTRVVVPAGPSRLAGPGPVTSLPSPQDASRIASVLAGHPGWSAFWDKASGVWRVTEDDPDSALHAESSDAATVVSYIQSHA
jgi:hypothetical protein